MARVTRTIQNTPMAPYAGLMKSMEPRDIQTVILFLQNALHDTEMNEPTTEDKYLAEKMKNAKNELSESFLKMRGCVSFSPEEIASDDRLAYIQSR